MYTETMTPERLAASVLAVPPLARRDDGSLHADENQRLIRHLEAGGVSTLLYGGNANLYHVSVSEYGRLLEMLADLAGQDTLVIPSVGPSFGVMLDQARILREFDFPTAMILPQPAIFTPEGVLLGVRRFVEAFGRPAVLYIKEDGYVPVDGVAALADEGLLSAIKYAAVRDDPADDAYLRSLTEAVDRSLIVSGVGEPPAVSHLLDFGLVSFTSGSVSIAPRLSMRLLGALQARDLPEALALRELFMPLEELRNRINPIRVLHAAVSLAGVAEMGPLYPLLTGPPESELHRIEVAAQELLARNND